MLGLCVAGVLAFLSTDVDRALSSPPVPTVVTESGTPLGETSATLSGSVNPNGSNVSDCHFEYGTSTSYGSSAACAQVVGSGLETVNVSALTGGLLGGTVLHYRVVASNEGGPSFGEDRSLLTPLRPLVLTSLPLVPLSGGVGQPLAYSTLQGSASANGSQVTDCHFEYGIGSSFGSNAACSQAIGSGSSPVYVSAVVGLQWGSSYSARLVATNVGGTSYGDTQSFQTPTLSTPYVVPITPPVTYPYPSYYQAPHYTEAPHYTYTPPDRRARISAGRARCLKLRGTRRSKCLAALRGPSGGNPNDVGLYVAFCPRRGGASSLRASSASTSEKGWPPKQCLKMDKGPAGRHHTIVGMKGVHNWLLGGYGSDTIIGGNLGDVIWGDYHPYGQPKHQTAIIHAGNGRNVIYANDTLNYVWTGTNPKTVVHAHVSGISGVIHCGSSQQVMFLSTDSEKHFKLDGCGRISHYSVGY